MGDVLEDGDVHGERLVPLGVCGGSLEQIVEMNLGSMQF